MDRTTRIVTIGRDWTLQHSRTLLLRAAGYRVREARTENEVLTLISASRAGAIGLLLICHTVSENSRVRLVKAAKAKLPGMPILLLYNGWDRKLPQNALRHLSRQSQSVDVPVDGWLQCTDITPGALLSMVGLLISATPGRAVSARSIQIKAR